uniref:Protein FAM98A n=1 Tax=Globodera rostochiensis TaxID=31243 RepID=A0A914HHB2_GLORO
MEIDQQQQDGICENIASISRHLNLPLSDNVDTAYLALFKTKLVDLANESKKLKSVPRLLLPSSSPLDDKEWAKLSQYIDLFNSDYAQRALLLKRRAEVTVDSFLWSDRVQKMEDKIRDVLEVSGFTNLCFDPVYADEVLVANTDLLYVTKTSDAQLRKDTRSFVTAHRVKADVVPDRGGRTEKMQPMQRETFQQQETQRHQQQFRRGGGGGAGRGGGWNDGNRAQSDTAAGGGGGGWHSGGGEGHSGGGGGHSGGGGGHSGGGGGHSGGGGGHSGGGGRGAGGGRGGSGKRGRYN